MAVVAPELAECWCLRRVDLSRLGAIEVATGVEGRAGPLGWERLLLLLTLGPGRREERKTVGSSNPSTRSRRRLSLSQDQVSTSSVLT